MILWHWGEVMGIVLQSADNYGCMWMFSKLLCMLLWFDIRNECRWEFALQCIFGAQCIQVSWYITYQILTDLVGHAVKKYPPFFSPCEANIVAGLNTDHREELQPHASCLKHLHLMILSMRVPMHWPRAATAEIDRIFKVCHTLCTPPPGRFTTDEAGICNNQV